MAYTLTDNTGKSLYGPFSANSDLDSTTIGQTACSILGLPYLLLTTSTPNPTYGVAPDPSVGGPTPAGYFQRWITFQFAARPIAVSSWQLLINQLRGLTLTAGQASELAPIVAALQAAGAVFDTTAVTGGLNASLYALQTQAWAANTGAPAWAEMDRVARSIYGQFPPASGSAAATTFGVTLASPKVLPLPFDVTAVNQTTLFARATAALGLIPSTSPGLTSIMATATTGWISALLLKYPSPNPTVDAASTAAVTALASATSAANAFLSIAGFA